MNFSNDHNNKLIGLCVMNEGFFCEKIGKFFIERDERLGFEVEFFENTF